ncbi:MAG: MYXO-CTERM sorting domain-containing protein, partial [Myxococcales bacterium]|nr:MYXO-CTERM sorting domain-containing protein [Myxococcales bacterium]
ERIASLELIPAYFPDDGPDDGPGDGASPEWASPVGVLAITRDAEGERIVGAPIEWSLTRGVLDVRVADPGDVLSLADTCRASPDEDPEPRGATVEASVAGLVTSIDLEWTAVPGEVPVPDSTNPNCVGSSCSCSTDAEPEGSLAAALGLLLLGLGRRRRSGGAQASPARKRP